jgi:hypothetical protein
MNSLYKNVTSIEWFTQPLINTVNCRLSTSVSGVQNLHGCKAYVVSIMPHGVIVMTHGVSVMTHGVSVMTHGVSVMTQGVSVMTHGVSLMTHSVSVMTHGVSGTW